MAMLPDAEECNTGELADLYNYIGVIQHATGSSASSAWYVIIIYDIRIYKSIS